jgi:hypothetical protein
VCVHVSMQTFVHACTNAYVRLCACVRARDVCISVLKCACMCVCACVCVHVCALCE